MGKDDHYLFMDGCVVKGCKPVLDFERTFGEYAELLEDLFHKGRWGHGEKGRFGRRAASRDFDDWADEHIHAAQSTQNMRTGADRVNNVLEGISGEGNIHLFGTSAAGAAMLVYFVLCEPKTLYVRSEDSRNEMVPAQKYTIDRRIASLTTIDAPTNWAPVKHDEPGRRSVPGKDALGDYLMRHTRIKAGAGCGSEETNRMEDVPGTWIGAQPVAGMCYDNRPHYKYLPDAGMERHIYTGSHASDETREFLERVWR